MKKNIKTINITEKKDIFENPKVHFLMIGIIIVVISTLFFTIGFQKYIPSASDTQQWRWAAEELIEHNHTEKDRALWTDNMFSGMPSYLISFPPKYPFFNNIPTYLNKIINWRVVYLIFGAIGMYLLIVYLKFSPLIALFSALAFALSPHFIGLIDIGHNTKFRAIMYIPWIFLTFEDLRQKKRLLSVGLLSIFLIDQLRINHFQISYYTYMMLAIYWLVFLIDSIKEKTIKSYLIFTSMLIFALAITVLAVANPYLSTYEYSHFTIRGIGGATIDYATGWSYGIAETLSLFVPYMYGGINSLYWGPMGSTQVFHYMGILVLFLALIGSIFSFKDNKVKALVVISIISLLISYGKHFSLLSNLLLNYLPLFNKFRVPAMILCLLQFAIPVLAAYGFKAIIDNTKNSTKSVVTKKNVDALFITLIVSFVLSVGVFFLFFTRHDIFSEISYTSANSRGMFMGYWDYTVDQYERVKLYRMDLLMQSGIRSFALLSCSILMLILLLKGLLKKNVILLLLIGLTVYDLTHINNNYLTPNSLVHESNQNQFETTDTDVFLLRDNDLFRIFPFHPSELNNARWSYYHQNLGGYHGAKLRRYQHILENNLYSEIVAGLPINLNIINMLNVKYVIFDRFYDIQNNDLVAVHHDVETRHTIYLNNGVLPRAWFVKDHEIIQEQNRMSLRLNDPTFNPAVTALLEDKVPSFSYDEESYIQMLERSIHHTRWVTSNEVDSFMVISEIYYPPGWNIYINNVKSDIYPVNICLRGAWVPAGENVIEMKFEPDSYRFGVLFSAIGLILALLVTVIGAVVYYKTNFGKGVVYKISS